VGITTTIWVSPGGAPADAVKTASPPAVSASSESPAQFFQTSAKSSTAAPPAPTTLATTSSPPAAAIPSSHSVAAAPPVSSSSSAVPVVIPTTSAAPVVVPTTSAAVAASPSASAASGGSSSGGKSGGGGTGSFSGDLTFYDFSMGQTGSCGTSVDGTATRVIALPIDMMNSKLKAAGLTDPNKNPLCGASVTIYYNGQSTTAVIADSCYACTGNSIDLSHKAFDDLGIAESAGRVQGTWSFN